MKTNIETEIAQTRNRLRLICEWFEKLNTEITGLPTPGVTPVIRDKIAAQKFHYSDLMAIRNSPGAWTLRNPYIWLWILHRYQNGEGKQPGGGAKAAKGNGCKGKTGRKIVQNKSLKKI